MKKIQIKFEKESKFGRLYYFRDPQIDHVILYLQNDSMRRVFHSININHLISLTMNKEYIINTVEIMYPRKFWEIDEILFFPTPNCSADVRVRNIKPHNNTLLNEVKVYTDSQFRIVKILFDKTKKAIQHISLSNQCVAIVSEDNILCGFIVNIEATPVIFEDANDSVIQS